VDGSKEAGSNKSGRRSRFAALTNRGNKILWKNRNDERPKAGLSPRETFLAAIAKAIGDAEDSGILDREIARILTAERMNTNTVRPFATIIWGVANE
jgi:hypothetical protein